MAHNTSLKVIEPGAGLVIEAGVPIPGVLGRSPLMSAFRELAKANVGASFFVPPSFCTQGGQISERAVRVGGPGWVTVRKVEGGYRAWKIAEPSLAKQDA